ncbi:hypothetical protein AUC69_12440 [Methyloceanibacter superfactus]|uniref:Capsule polysaccharide biosynthesis protein n=1 Tax=Methyloceanibacter superfactus TaxID=1774969 RepID=A0A1E3VV59_9HYPH|nr:hypothetical protein AUC69_12440 [Methyloceanibacter superfactus]
MANYAGNEALLNDVADLAVAMRRAQGFRASSQDESRPYVSVTVECICESFWSIEKRLTLLDWNVGDAFPWPLIRMALFYAVAQKVGLYQPPHPVMSSGKGLKRDRSKTKHRKSFPSSGLVRAVAGAYGKFAKSHRCGVLMATRRTGGTELYTKALRAELGSGALLLDRAWDGTIAKGAVDFDNLLSEYRARYRDQVFILTFRDRMVCEEIREQFFDRLGVDIGDLAKLCQSRTASFLKLRKGFTEFFGMNPVKKLFLTNAYGLSTTAALEGARAQGAHVIELQHGIISPFHLGYSWPGRPQVPYSPDELWCFGKFWPESTPLPAKTSSRVIGAPYVYELAAKAVGPRDEKIVVFTSQGVVGQQLFGMALEAARRRPDLQIVFRLHPSEILEQYEDSLRGCDDVPSNFSLSHRDPNIFALLATAAIQVGAFSTTLFEGMSLGTRTIVVDLPGAEYMRPVIGKGDALLVRDVDELVSALDRARSRRIRNIITRSPQHGLSDSRSGNQARDTNHTIQTRHQRIQLLGALCDRRNRSEP